MNTSIKPQFTLIPGIAYRVLVGGEERELVFFGRYDCAGKAHLQWQDPDSREMVNQECGLPGFEVVRVLS